MFEGSKPSTTLESSEKNRGSAGKISPEWTGKTIPNPRQPGKNKLFLDPLVWCRFRAFYFGCKVLQVNPESMQCSYPFP